MDDEKTCLACGEEPWKYSNPQVDGFITGCLCSPLVKERAAREQAERLLREARSATIEECRAWLVAHYYSTLAGQMVDALAAHAARRVEYCDKIEEGSDLTMRYAAEADGVCYACDAPLNGPHSAGCDRVDP